MLSIIERGTTVLISSLENSERYWIGICRFHLNHADFQARSGPHHPVPEGRLMSEIGPHKLTDALKDPQHPAGDAKTHKPTPTHDEAAEQTREAQESAKAHNAEAGVRDHMIDIGRGNQQAGRQGQ